MRALRIPLRVVFYREGDIWLAHCLEFDLIGNGATKEEAIHLLNEAIDIQLRESLEHNNPSNLFCPADGKYFEMFAAAARSFDCSQRMASPTSSFMDADPSAQSSH